MEEESIYNFKVTIDVFHWIPHTVNEEAHILLQCATQADMTSGMYSVLAYWDVVGVSWNTIRNMNYSIRVSIVNFVGSVETITVPNYHSGVAQPLQVCM